jgi:hypothetical protein
MIRQELFFLCQTFSSKIPGFCGHVTSPFNSFKKLKMHPPELPQNRVLCADSNGCYLDSSSSFSLHNRLAQTFFLFYFKRKSPTIRKKPEKITYMNYAFSEENPGNRNMIRGAKAF